jgi:hypothetical protein
MQRLEARPMPPLAPGGFLEADPVQLDSSSADEIDSFEVDGYRVETTDKPQLNVYKDGATHAFDLDSDGPRPNAVASSSRVHEDGPSTLLLQQRYERSSSPIEQFEEKREPRSGHVKDMVKSIEDRNKGGPSTPHINFREIAPVKSNMKGKVSKTYRRNVVI